jgi:hypothetical protein
MIPEMKHSDTMLAVASGVISKNLNFDTSERIFLSSAAYGPMKSTSCTRFFVDIQKCL